MKQDNNMTLDELYSQLSNLLEQFQNFVSNTNPTMLDMFRASACEVLSIAKATQMAYNSGGQIDPVKLYNDISPIFTDPSVISDYQEKKRKIRKVSVTGLRYIRMDAIIKALDNGIMEYESDARVDEVEGLREERIVPLLTNKEGWNDDFKEKLAKLKRHLIIEQDIILIDRTSFGPYAIDNMEKFSMDEKKAIFELEATLDLINKDLVAQNPKLQAIINKHRPQPTIPNVYAPGIITKQILKLPNVLALVTDRQKYNAEWIDKFIDTLMASEHGDGIAKDWQNIRKRDKIPALIAGTLVKAGVFPDNKALLARTIRKGYDFHVKTDCYSTYMGKTEEQPYLDWVLHYVKKH